MDLSLPEPGVPLASPSLQLCWQGPLQNSKRLINQFLSGNLPMHDPDLAEHGGICFILCAWFLQHRF